MYDTKSAHRLSIILQEGHKVIYDGTATVHDRIRATIVYCQVYRNGTRTIIDLFTDGALRVVTFY